MKSLMLGTANFKSSYGFSRTYFEGKLEDVRDALISGKYLGLDLAFSYGINECEIYEILDGLSCSSVLKFKLSNFNSLNEAIYNLRKIIDDSGDWLKCVMFHDSKEIWSRDGQEILRNLLNWKAKGLIKEIGASVYSTVEIERVVDNFIPDRIQIPFNVANRAEISDTNLISAKEKFGFKIDARSIFLQGILLRDSKRDAFPSQQLREYVRNLQDFAIANRCSVLEICAEYVNTSTQVDRVVVGVEKPEQIDALYRIFSKRYEIDTQNLPRIDGIFVDPRMW